MKTSWFQTGATAAAVVVVGGLAVVATAQDPSTAARVTPPPLPPPSGQSAPAQLTPQAPPPAQTLPSVPVPPAPTQPKPQAFTWPGGSVIVNGPEVILRTTGPRGLSSNVITGSGNGIGNRIVVGNGGAGGTTYLHGSRNGIGNRIVIDSGDLLIDIDALLKELPVVPRKPALPVIPPAAEPAAAPAPGVAPAAAPAPSYKGKDNPFWSKKQFSDAHDCNLYWDPVTRLWFRYGAEDDTYRPVANPPAPPRDDQ